MKVSSLGVNLWRSFISFSLLEMKVQKVSPTNMTKIEKDDIVLPDDIFSEGVFLFHYLKSKMFFQAVEY